MSKTKITVTKSDISQTLIPEGEGVKITIKFNDPKRGYQYVLDALEEEVKDLISKGDKQGLRGRKPSA